MTTFTDSVKLGGGDLRFTEASAVFYMPYSFDPTSATAIILGYVPPNAKIIDVVSFGGATGGTSPTINVGTTTTANELAAALRADVSRSAMATNTIASGANAVISAVTSSPIYGKVGASAATGGTAVGYVAYIVLDTWR